ncbi:MAG: class I SAM-dependent methyltransferase [Bacteroidales bacterium]|nr:class I SAM-dependent methyltransferase [Bacteroidales bacterium]
MNLFPDLEKIYTQEHLSAREAQRLAQYIAFGPVVFEASRMMIRFGILQLLRDNDEGLGIEDIATKCNISNYAAKVLLEASLSIGTVLVEPKTEKYRISKTGWFLLTNESTRVNMDFNHDVNYEGFFKLEESLKEGRPAGLEHFGSWPTIYEGLSSLPKQVLDSWMNFDHFYSDGSFDQALPIVFGSKPKRLLDVGGNTGRWAMKCVGYDKDIIVTIADLPQQLEMMRQQTAGLEGSDRIEAYPVNLLEEKNGFPEDRHFDVIWMSQFLDCFSENEIQSILERASRIMDENTRLFIMETFWDRQKYETAAFCLTMTSLYFTAMANGNSKMYHSADMQRIVEKAGLEVETVHDYLGQGHSIMVCKKK